MSWKADRNGKITNLDRSNQPESRVSEANASDSSFLAKYLTRFGQIVADIAKKWSPDFAEFEVVSTGTTGSPQKVSLTHNFGAPVSWWVTGITGVSGTAIGLIQSMPTSTDKVIDLNFYWAGTFLIRVEKSQ